MSITDQDSEEALHRYDHMPDKSAVIRVGGSFFLCNISTLEIEDFELAKLELRRGSNGIKIKKINDVLVARKLYEIANPNGPEWTTLYPSEKEKYIRLQDAGIKP